MDADGRDEHPDRTQRRGLFGSLQRGATGVVRTVAKEVAPGVVDAVDVNEVVERLDVQGVIDRIIGAGTLVVQSASEAGRQVFDHIRKPEEVQKTIYHQGELNQQRMMAGDVGRSSHSATSELERLADLRARGVLTEEEFQAQKRRILG